MELKMGNYRIVLADDHAMLREGIKKIINSAKGMEVVGEAGDGLELIEVLKKVSPDMAILDISMPKLRGIEATHEIKDTYPNIKVLILSMHKKKEYFQRAMTAGADGYLLKEDTSLELINAIQAIRNGRPFLSSILIKEFPQDLLNICLGEAEVDDDPLSIRERQVLKLLAEGKTSREIAEVLYISVRTAQHHRANVKKKLKLKKTADLVKYAISKGYTPNYS
jgi:two-component system, NarL family, response regulator NreC